MIGREQKKLADGLYELSRWFLELGRSVLTVDNFQVPAAAKAFALRVEDLKAGRHKGVA